MRNQKVKIYISYSLQNTSTATLNQVRNYLISKGYEVAYYEKNTIYSTSDLDNADFILFIGTKYNELSLNEESHSLSKGQYTELERTIKNNKPFAFFAELSSLNELIVAKHKLNYVNDLNDWKRKYGIVHVKYDKNGFGYFIEDIIPENIIIYKSNHKLLLIL